MESALAVERENQQILFQSEDAKEGLAAYVEKRPATFTAKREKKLEPQRTQRATEGQRETTKEGFLCVLCVKNSRSYARKSSQNRKLQRVGRPVQRVAQGSRRQQG